MGSSFYGHGPGSQQNQGCKFPQMTTRDKLTIQRFAAAVLAHLSEN